MSLGAFSNLQTLALRDVSIGAGCLCSALGAMPLLSNLSIVQVSFLRNTPSPTSDCSMTQLTSFEFRLASCEDYLVWRWIETAAKGFTHLRRLSYDFPKRTYWLPSSKTMTHLTLHMKHPMAPEQLIQIPEIMPHLESLKIHNYREQQLCYIPSCMFLRMKGLRSLSLSNVDVDLNFFKFLASLEHLTELRLRCRQNTVAAHLVRFHAEANRLQNLLYLSLSIRDPHRSLVLEHLSGVKLSRLQVLELPECELDADQKNHLFSRFPSLRRFSSD